MFGKSQKFFILFWLIPISLIYLHATDTFDQDLGRHLKIGEIIWQTREVPKVNLFSYTNPDEPIFNSHWGSEVVFYVVHNKLGLPGLIVLSTIINTLVFSIVFVLAVRRTGVLVPSILFIPFMFILLDRSWVRPEMFGNLLFALLLIFLFSPRIKKAFKWGLPIIILLWVNVHITWLLGILGVFIVLIQDVIDRGGIKNRRTIRVNTLIFIFSVLALSVNPYGVSIIYNSFTVLSKYGYSIVENQSWFFLKDFGFPLVSHIFFGLVIVIASFSIFIIKPRKILFGEILLLIVLSILTLRFVRNEILFAYIAFLSASFNFSSLININLSTVKRQIIIVVVFFFSTYLIINSHNMAGLPVGFGSRESYKEGVNFFIKNNLKGPIFNNFDIGGYLIYRLHAQEKVFVDNRPEGYPVSFFQDVYIPMQIDRVLFAKFADQYGIETIIWGIGDITPWSRDFLGAITKDEMWKIVYRDDATIILTGP